MVRDSVYAREWGYGTSHYMAADYELGYPEGSLSPTAAQDVTGSINACHDRGIRIFLDVVLGRPMRRRRYRLQNSSWSIRWLRSTLPF